MLLVLLVVPATADDKVKLFATTEAGYGRIIIDFPDRLDLPPYRISSENGVLAVEFDTPVDLTLPDVLAALPDYTTVARVDPDRKGVRFGLRSTFSVNHLEAGEQLFIDLMPPTWQGLPPGLPAEVVAKLAERARQAAIRAEQQRKAAEAKINNPVATLRVGRNPTFLRAEFSWNVDTDAKFAIDGETGNLDFEWPVPVDLYLLKADLPKELQGVDDTVTADGSRISFHVAAGVTPRFYAISKRDFIVDIDTASTVPANPNPAAAATAKALQDAQALGQAGRTWWTPALAAVVRSEVPLSAPVAATPITPEVRTLGSTVRVSFPFEQDTPAAVFRRGDTVWMFFDTLTGINQPAFSQDLANLAKNFTVVPAGDMQVVRLDLSSDRLASLGSEGKSWVLSLGDMLLTATEPVSLSRRIDGNGLYQITADLERPSRVHRFKDPVVGDTLTVVTAYPPARGVAHDLDFVDFEALRSVHGLVIRPNHDDVTVGIDNKLAVIGAPDGLIVSSPSAGESVAGDVAPPASRQGYMDLSSLRENDPLKFNARASELSAAAARAEVGQRDAARLKLARFYLANRFAFEAVGVLRVLAQELQTDTLKNDTQLALAAADVVAYRPADAIPILSSDVFANEIDARMWRSMAEAEAEDWAEAKRDALASEPIINSYPTWVKTRFQLSALRAAVETGDTTLAERLYKAVAFGDLDPEQVTFYQLLNGRIAEAEGRRDEALDIYGQVIAADVRPTRAEAVYRTILILDQTKRIDAAKATQTLAAEAMLWRGNSLEADMDELLTTLYFRAGDYRLGLETAKQTVRYFPASPKMDALSAEAQSEFEDLFLNGKADALDPVGALSLYYDYRTLTPPGSRGDEMIRNLAQRLVKVDLLSQAADLLRYQVANRLNGAAQSQIAADLAVIDIANRNPQDALKVLNATELADLPPSLDRQRRILRARALIDSNRLDLALDVLTPLTGRDVDRLRVEANWNAKNYDAAGNLLEVMYSSGTNQSGPAMATASRVDILRAAVAFALADDKIGLSRLRSKFADALASGPEWPMFDYVTTAVQPASGPQFDKAAGAVAGLDTLDGFLKSYKQVYGDNAGLMPNGTTAGKNG
ncbi:MAG: hypothetical protein P4M09_09805 [Devosia sp.]|nr:hypothetical protein [Devosia sp.]